MLVLARGVDETLVFTVPASTEPTTITVMVCDVRRGVKRVRLGVEAPKPVTVNRGEVQERMGR